MRSFLLYGLAVLLVAASIPIYMAISKARGLSPSQPPVSLVASPVLQVDRNFVSGPRECLAGDSRNMCQALFAVMHGRAKCVAGVVYRTYDHVIEPWPGNVYCPDYSAKPRR